MAKDYSNNYNDKSAKNVSNEKNTMQNTTSNNKGATNYSAETANDCYKNETSNNMQNKTSNNMQNKTSNNMQNKTSNAQNAYSNKLESAKNNVRNSVNNIESKNSER